MASPHHTPKKGAVHIALIVLVVILVIAGATIVSSHTWSVQKKAMDEAASASEPDVNIVDDGAMTIRTEEGTFSTSGTVPASWPTDIPLYPGAHIQFSGGGESAGILNGLVVVLSSTDSDATIVNFYATQLSDAGWEVKNATPISGASIMAATKEARSISISIVTTEGKTSITIAVRKE